MTTVVLLFTAACIVMGLFLIKSKCERFVKDSNMEEKDKEQLTKYIHMANDCLWIALSVSLLSLFFNSPSVIMVSAVFMAVAEIYAQNPYALALAVFIEFLAMFCSRMPA